MRILILPLVIILLCSSLYGFSQGTCATAYTLPMDGSCQNYAMGPLGSGTGFRPITGVGCNYTNDRRVTWFKFTPASNIMAANFSIFLADATAELQATFYDPGAACGFGINSPNSTLCSATGGGILTPTAVLLSGRTYYIRVYANINENLSHFINVCATPASFQTVPVDGTCNNYNVGDLGTGPGFSPLPTGTTNRCGYANDRRVTWIKFVPSSTITCATFNINLDVSANTEVAFYNQAGAYQSGSTLCMPNGSGIWAPSLPATLTAGNTYYLRIYTNINDNNPHTINICASPYVPPNDLCSTATRIDDQGTQDNNVCATGSGSPSPPNEPAWITSNSVNLVCAPVLQNTAWYYFIVEDNTQTTTVSVSGVNCSNYGGGDLSGGKAGIQIGVLQGVPAIPNCTTNNGLIVPPNTAGNHCLQTTLSSFAFNVNPGPSVQNGTKMYIAVDGYNGANCSYVLTTSNAIPIPVKMKYFTVWKMAESNQLRWITSWETNNRNFQIERSLNGRDFTVIGTVNGLTNSSTDVQYKFDDTEAPLLAYYRLKQVDIDEHYEYSNVIIIRRDNIKSLFSLAFENPVRNSGIVTISTEKAGMTTLRVVDVAGRELSTQVVDCGRGNNMVVKDYSRLPGGNYFLVATQGENRIVKPFVKQ